MREKWNIGVPEYWRDRRVENQPALRLCAPKFHQSHAPTLHFFARKAGFSLLEVLVALAIFGIAAGGILVALGHHLKNVTYLKDYAQAVRIASREMNALRRNASLDVPEEGADGRFVWTAEVSTDGLDEWPGLENADGTPVRLAVTVQWRDHADGPALGKVHLDGFEVF